MNACTEHCGYCGRCDDDDRGDRFPCRRCGEFVELSADDDVPGGPTYLVCDACRLTQRAINDAIFTRWMTNWMCTKLADSGLVLGNTDPRPGNPAGARGTRPAVGSPTKDVA